MDRTTAKASRPEHNPLVVPKFRGEKRKRYEELMSLRDGLADQMRDLSTSTRSYHKEAGEDLADVGSETFSRDMGLALISEEGHKIALIQDAIRRLIDSTYGICIDCNCTIHSGRLDAIPYAKLCIDCKAAREVNDNMPPVDIEADELTE